MSNVTKMRTLRPTQTARETEREPTAKPPAASRTTPRMRLDNMNIGGVPIATDEIDGVHYQRMKLIDGTSNGTAGAVIDAVFGLAVDLKRSAALSINNHPNAPLSTASVVAVAGTDGAVKTLAALNVSRRGLIVYNNSAQPMNLRYGTGASASLFTARLLPGGYWEMPQPVFTGQITAVWDAAVAGGALITELS